MDLLETKEKVKIYGRPQDGDKELEDFLMLFQALDM
jgi:hypothetical protein